MPYGCVIAFNEDIIFLVNPKAFSDVDLTECGLQIHMSKSKLLTIIMSRYPPCCQRE